jgi:GH24 family phage-related lysozyme (muramidase)
MNDNSKDYLKFDWSPIINWESGGKSYYEKHLNRFTYPGGASGPTIMIGVDCAYYNEKELRNIFSFLSNSDVQLIVGCIGKTGTSAKTYIKKLSHIKIPWDNAEKVFYDTILPKFYNLTLKVWPKVEYLCPNAQVALTSIVFNRGASLIGSSRIEMREIKNLVPTKNYKEISEEILKMKRIWIGKNLDGLLKRRDEESKLVLSCLN